MFSDSALPNVFFKVNVESLSEINGLQFPVQTKSEISCAVNSQHCIFDCMFMKRIYAAVTASCIAHTSKMLPTTVS